MQVSEPSCIIDLRRVPHGVGRVGLQALIFPVSIVNLTIIPRARVGYVKVISRQRGGTYPRDV